MGKGKRKKEMFNQFKGIQPHKPLQLREKTYEIFTSIFKKSYIIEIKMFIEKRERRLVFF